nr:uncharacterized protein LOC120364007 [Saimiri boliviensis boliviensis]
MWPMGEVTSPDLSLSLAGPSPQKQEGAFQVGGGGQELPLGLPGQRGPSSGSRAPRALRRALGRVYSAAPAARTQLKTRAQRAPPAAGDKETAGRKWKPALLETKCPRGCFSGGRALRSQTGRVGSVAVRVRVSSSGALISFLPRQLFSQNPQDEQQRTRGAGEASSGRLVDGHGPQHGNLVLFFNQVSVSGEPLPVKRRKRASATPNPLERPRAGRGTGEGTISPSGGAHGSVVTHASKRAL